MKEEWAEAIIRWAEGNPNVVEAWLFGSQAKGTAAPSSDVDICVRLAPGAFGNYMALGDQWQRELAAALNKSVSFEAMTEGSEEEREVMSTGVMLFRRQP